MVKSKHFLFSCGYSLLIIITVEVQAQNQSGFISIDCGSSSTYVDEITGLTYFSDANYTETGINVDLSPEYKLQAEKQLWNVRSFPEGKRNCYTLKPPLGKGNRYLIRAMFLYGNYDNRGLNPAFALYLGVDLWDIVLSEDPRIIQLREIIYVPLSDYIHICLINTGNGIPFISVLELRPLSNVTYSSPTGTGLQVVDRLDLNSNSDSYMRFKDDVYDRIWNPMITDRWEPLNTSQKDVNSITKSNYKMPSSVMSTAYTRNRTTGFMAVILTRLISSSKYFFYMHFAELEKLEKNQSREFNVFMNGALWYGPFSPKYLTETTIESVSGIKPDRGGNIVLWLNKTRNTTLPPLLNALEVYSLMELPQLQTNQSDFEAISNIKSVYEVKRISWQGDPCAPKDYMWDGLNCSYNGNSSHRIKSLDLSSSGLKGKISSFIAELTMLEYLDLSNNSLSGTLPAYLADLPNLKNLNLKGNNLDGLVPPALVEISKNGLMLQVDDSVFEKNKDSSLTPSPSPPPSNAYWIRKDGFVIPLVASMAACLLHFI